MNYFHWFCSFSLYSGFSRVVYIFSKVSFDKWEISRSRNFSNTSTSSSAHARLIIFLTPEEIYVTTCSLLLLSSILGFGGDSKFRSLIEVSMKVGK